MASPCGTHGCQPPWGVFSFDPIDCGCIVSRCLVSDFSACHAAFAFQCQFLKRYLSNEISHNLRVVPFAISEKLQITVERHRHLRAERGLKGHAHTESHAASNERRRGSPKQLKAELKSGPRCPGPAFPMVPAAHSGTSCGNFFFNFSGSTLVKSYLYNGQRMKSTGCLVGPLESALEGFEWGFQKLMTRF